MRPMSLKLSIEQEESVREAVAGLDNGTYRICEKVDNQWTTNQWLKKAVLTYFRTEKMVKMEAGFLSFADKIPLKSWEVDSGVRVVPHALVRHGAFVEKGAVLMPSYINIGARVSRGTLVDTWATIGSCAQIGENCHVSGGVGIGGVLEPVQANPVVVENNVFLGSRVILVEGVLVKEGAVLGAGVTLTSSTKIMDVTGPETVIHRGLVPENSVVIPGSYEKVFPAGKFNVPCALIIGKRKASTDKKTSLNNALREFDVPV